VTDGKHTGRWIRHTVGPEDTGRSVEEILTGPLQVSRRMIQRLTRSRGISINSRPAFLKRRVKAGDVVAIRTSDRSSSALAPVPVDLAIVYEDADLVVVDKAANILVHPSSPGHTRTLVHGLVHHFTERGEATSVHPVHRLDRDTSGLVLFARSAFGHQHLDRQLRLREMSREYLGVVEGYLQGDAGEIDAPIGVSPKDSRLRAVRQDGQPATTRYQVRELLRDSSVVGLRLETGRTHQIRVHLGHIGHPVVGDAEYGARPVRLIRRYALHAERLAFRHPRSGALLELTAPIPDDISRLIANLRRT